MLFEFSHVSNYETLESQWTFHFFNAGSILPWRAFQFIAKQSSEGGSVSSSIVQQLQQLYT